jgi:hypothetical protein|nr:MAG TPA: hypothetical protein [Caudoviricetes sp.]
MIIDDSIRDRVGETAYDTWKDAALATLSNLICMSDLEQTINDMTGIVSQDGKHGHLASWYSEVWSVKTTDNTPVGYKVTYGKNDGLSPSTSYTKIITLTSEYPAGTELIISGRHGFKKLPAPLANILTAIIQADQSMADRTDSITSKRIEDVSVSYATSTQTTLERATTPYKALISSWSLCLNQSDTGGILDMPTPHHELPWWFNPQDYLGGDYAYGIAM